MIRSLISSTLRTNKSRRVKWGKHVSLMGTNRNTYRVLVRKPEGLDLEGRKIFQMALTDIG
jgi:hypothetical protein